MAGKKIERIDHIDKEATYKDLFFIGHYLHDYPAYQHAHRHNYYEVLWLPQGSGNHYIDGTKYPLTGNDLFLITDGQVHWFENNKNLQGYLLSFKENFWEEAPVGVRNAKTALFNNLLINSHFHLSNEVAAEVSALLQNIQSEYEKEDYANKSELLAAYVKILLIKLENIKQPTHPEHKPDYTLFQKFVEQLELHFRTNHEAAWYATQLFVSNRKLSDVCNTFSGRSTKDLINTRIITEAKRTLQFTTSAIKELADMLGFTDQYQFSKFFKKHTSHSPVDYRAQFAQIDI